MEFAGAEKLITHPLLMKYRYFIFRALFAVLTEY